MNLLNFSSLLVALLLAFTFVSCDQEQPSVVSSEITSEYGSKVWTDEEIADYFVNVFERPSNPTELEIPFFGRKHRSQLSSEELQILLDKEAKIREKYEGRTIEEVKAITEAQWKERLEKAKRSENSNMIQSVSDYFFYITNYDSRDWDWFDIANMSYGNMIYPYSTNPWIWDTHTDYMTSTSTTSACRGFLAVMVTYSYVGYLVSSSTSNGNCFYTYPEESIIIYGGLMKMLPGLAGNFITSVPGSYVETDLNPGFEDWTGGYPDAWNISISSPYNIPSAWNSYYSTANVVQSSNEYQGTYAVQLELARNVGKSLASAYYVLPGAVEPGEYTASIYYGGTPQSVQMVLEIALYDDSDALIGSATGDLSVGDGGAYKLNSITYDTDTDLPKYVRFNVRQAVGQNREDVRVDNLSLRGPLGDVPLPAVFGGITFQNYVSYRKIDLDWYTYSEVGTDIWKLFFRDGGQITAASSETEPAAGNDPDGETYSEDFYLYYSAWIKMTYLGELDVFLGVKDIGGEWEYFEEEGVTVDYP